jgi:hypothetical protein
VAEALQKLSKLHHPTGPINVAELSDFLFSCGLPRYFGFHDSVASSALGDHSLNSPPNHPLHILDSQFAMASTSLLRTIARGPSTTFFRAYRPVAPSRAGAIVPGLIAGSSLNFSTTVARRSDPHAEETFEEFTAR